MRVVLVVQKLAGLRGGAERLVIDLAAELDRRGHDTTVISFEPTAGAAGFPAEGVLMVNLFPRWARRAAALFKRRPTGNVDDRGAIDAREQAVSTRGNRWPIASMKWHLTHGWFARRLRRWLRRHPVDVVVGFLPPAISAVAVAGTGMGSSRPRLIASTHNLPSEDFGDTPRWDQNPVARRTNVWALGAVDAVTVLQPEFVAQLPAAAQRAAVVLPNPVQRLAPPTGVPREPLIIGVGRLTEVKRYEVVVDAFALIADDLPDWRVEIYGAGPERDALAARIAAAGLDGRVRLAGTTEAIADVYDRARLLVHPARYEGFGLSVAEAIMHGVLVVASATCTGVNRLVVDGRTGALVDEGTDPAGAFASGIRRLVDDPPADEVRAAAGDELADRLSPARYYAAWEQVLSGDLGATRRAAGGRSSGHGRTPER